MATTLMPPLLTSVAEESNSPHLCDQIWSDRLKMRSKVPVSERSPVSSRLGMLTKQEGVTKKRSAISKTCVLSSGTGTASPVRGHAKVTKSKPRMDRLLDRLRNEMAQLREHGTQMSRQVRQVYSTCEDAIRVVSPLHARVARPVTANLKSTANVVTGKSATTDTFHTTKTHVQVSQSTNSKSVANKDSSCDVQSAKKLLELEDILDASLDSTVVSESGLDADLTFDLQPLPADLSAINESHLHDVTIEGISVLELPTSLNKPSVDSQGRLRQRPVTFSKIKKIDKCSTNKWENCLSSMHSPRARRNSPFLRGKAKSAKRRLSDDFCAAATKAKDTSGKCQISAAVSEVVSTLTGTDVSRSEVNKADSEQILPADTDGWYVTLDDPHIYENINIDREVNVDAASLASANSSPYQTDLEATPPRPATPGSNEAKLTAVKRSMEKIIRDLRSPPAGGLVRTDSRCSTLKLTRSRSADNVLDSTTKPASSDPEYETVQLPTLLWGQVSPPRCPNPSSPETIRRCLFTMPRHNSPMSCGDMSVAETVAWETTFDRSLPLLSTGKSSLKSGATHTRSAFRPYSKNTDKSTSTKGSEKNTSTAARDDGREKYFETLMMPNNCQYICMDKSARANVLKSVTKRLFETPTLEDMSPVKIPDLMPHLMTSKWFPTPKLDDMQPVVIPDFTGGDKSFDGDETLVATSPSPRSNTSSDSGRGSCSSIAPSERSHLSSGGSGRSKIGEDSLESINEPIYETIADTYGGLDELTFDLGKSDTSLIPPAEHTYARIDETLSPEPPALPDRPVEYNLFERLEKENKKTVQTKKEVPTKTKQEAEACRVSKCSHCASCKNCNQNPGVKGQRQLRPDEMVKKTDIVDMNSFHMYTVADVLESMERLAGHIPENPGPKPKARQNLYGLISDAKTRREISQALELETKFRTHVPPSGLDKYRPKSSLQPVTKQPLRPIENIYNQEVSMGQHQVSKAVSARTAQQKSVQLQSEAKMNRQYNTMPINKVSRLACMAPHNNSQGHSKASAQPPVQNYSNSQGHSKPSAHPPAQPNFSRNTVLRRPVQQPVPKQEFKKAEFFRRSMGSIPSTTLVEHHQGDRRHGNQKRPVSASIERQPESDEHLYCNIEELRLQRERAQSQANTSHLHRLTQPPNLGLNTTQPTAVKHHQHQKNTTQPTAATKHHQTSQLNTTQNLDKKPQRSKLNTTLPIGDKKPQSSRLNTTQIISAKQTQSSRLNTTLPSGRTSRPKSAVFRENPKMTQVDIPAQNQAAKTATTSKKAGQRDTSRDRLNSSMVPRLASTQDMSIVSAHAGQNGAKVQPGPFRRTRSAMQLEWKGMNVTREIYC